MNRLIEQIAKAIENSEHYETYKVSKPQTIDVYLGQPSDSEQFEFTLPAVFIDYSIDYKYGNVTIDLHVLDEFGADTENFAPENATQQNYHKLLKAVRRSVVGVGIGKYFSKLQASNEMPIMTNTFHYHQISFTGVYNKELDPELNPYIQQDFETEIEK